MPPMKRAIDKPVMIAQPVTATFKGQPDNLFLETCLSIIEMPVECLFNK